MQEEELGELLKRLRAERGWSRETAAKAIGISRNRLEELELGVTRGTGRPTRPSRENVVNLAAAYGLPRDFLLIRAGYVAENPELTEQESYVLTVFRTLDNDQQALAMRLLAAIKVR